MQRFNSAAELTHTIRTREALTQLEIAKALRISVIKWRRWERGADCPKEMELLGLLNIAENGLKAFLRK